jgi:CheY-like chemotaxis protein
MRFRAPGPTMRPDGVSRAAIPVYVAAGMAHPHTVLIMDDDVDARRGLQELLELQGYTVLTAAEGAAGLAHLRRGFRPCFILLDLRMPGMDGWQFREEQMRDPELRHLPVAVFSGDADEEAAAAELGLTLILRKPLDVDRLSAMLEQHCAAARAAS